LKVEEENKKRGPQRSAAASHLRLHLAGRGAPPLLS